MAALIARFLLPFGDEPDWGVRAPELSNGIDVIFSPHYLFHSIIESVDVDASDCVVSSGPFKVTGSVSDGCDSDFSDSMSRFGLTAISLAPLFFILIFRRFYLQLIASFSKPHSYSGAGGSRLDSVSLALLFPGIIYYLGAFSNEQFFLIIAMYVFLFIDVWFILLPVMALLLVVDIGNFLVVLFFVVVFRISTYIVYRFGVKPFFILGGLSLMISYLVGFYFLEQINFLTLGLGFESAAAKSASIYRSLDGSIFVDNYPRFLRPVITYMSFVFMTPASLKAPLLYILVGGYVALVTYKILRIDRKDLILFWFVPVVTILFFTFTLPTHANAKYYIFCAPFFIFTALGVFSRYRIFGFFLCLIFLWFSQLLLYRV
jgi:hypothetical protein